VRSEALRVESCADQHLARLAERCNDLLAQANDAQQFVTLFCAIVDLSAGTLHYVNVGHNAPLLRQPGAPPEFIKGPRNPLAGLVPGLRFETGSMGFPSGSLLLLYTDGVTEAEAPDGSLFGDCALWRLFADDAHTGAQAGVARLGRTGVQQRTWPRRRAVVAVRRDRGQARARPQRRFHLLHQQHAGTAARRRRPTRLPRRRSAMPGRTTAW
jgi:hypothetical protein